METLNRRGPDFQATEQFSTAGLGHARLSILDPTQAAHQPMRSADGRYVLVYNGEVYNFRQLGRELTRAGVQLQTTSDTEVLLHLLIREGRRALSRLNGFFAFAFFDTQANTLLLARDRLGIKPLWVAREGSALYFASEMKALRALRPAKRQLNLPELAHYLQLNYTLPGTAIFSDAQELPPGAGLLATAQGVEEFQWWSLPAPPPPQEPARLSYEQACDELEERLRKAVAQRLVADVPLGVFLSGGIDSSVVAALAAEARQEIQTFSLGFDNSLYDETRYAKMVAAHCNTRHTVFHISTERLYEHLDSALDYLTEPFADASALNFYILARETRQRVTVALSGDGADELFGGYTKHLAEHKARGHQWMAPLFRLLRPLVKQLPAHRNSARARKLFQARKYALGLGRSRRERYWDWCSVQTKAEAQGLLRQPVDDPRWEALRAPFLAAITPGGDMNDVLRADLALVLGGDMLRKVDRMSMANALEVRVPFLDHELVEWVMALPAQFKLQGNLRKRILQDVSRRLLPAALYNRPKQGFEVPLRDWFLGPMRSRIEAELLNRELLEAQGLFEPAAVQRLWERICRGRNTKEDWTLWALYVFQRCYHRWEQEAKAHD